MSCPYLPSVAYEKKVCEEGVLLLSTFGFGPVERDLSHCKVYVKGGNLLSQNEQVLYEEQLGIHW